LVSRFEEPKVDDEVIRKRRNGTLEFCGNAWPFSMRDPMTGHCCHWTLFAFFVPCIALFSFVCRVFDAYIPTECCSLFCYYSSNLLLSFKATGYRNCIYDTPNHNKFKWFNFYFEHIHCCIHFAIHGNAAIIQLH
jgi:hypothetical protein